jgi:glycosyltransferase involved in cell wall biosynthesis
MHGMGDRGAILVLPTSTAGAQGPVAAWVSTAGWAAAVQRVVGDAWIVSTDGIVDPQEARRRGSHPALSAGSVSSWRRRVPTPVKTALKDARQWRRAHRFAVDPAGPWQGRDLAFVWQRHELFHLAGLRLARALDVPSVLFVPSTLVWEAEQWGVGRPGWSGWLERHGEAPALRGADLVACGSDRVAQEANRLGVPAGRILVTPTGVDLDLFRGGQDSGALRRRLGIEDRLVVGWVGSFRRFHALDVAVEAASHLNGVALLLVGDGPERAAVEALARERGVQLVTTGTVPHAELPAYLGAMDVGLVLASRDQTFHYSPLKLAEYLAAGLPVVAPQVSQIADRLADGVEAMLVPPGDTAALIAALAQLRDAPALRRRISARARSAAGQWSWDRQVERIVAALG